MTENNGIETLERLLREELEAAISGLVPRFRTVMPEEYFAYASTAEQRLHLRAIIGAENSGLPQEILLKNAEAGRYTFITKRNYPGQLSELLSRLPDDEVLHSAHIFTAVDGSIIIDMFEFGELARADIGVFMQSPQWRALLEATTAQNIANEKLREHVQRCSSRYLTTMTAEDVLKHYCMTTAVKGSDDVVVEITPLGEGLLSVTLCGGNANRRYVLERCSRYFAMHAIDIRYAQLETLCDEPEHGVTLLFLVVRPEQACTALEVDHLQNDLLRLPYLDAKVLALVVQLKWELQECEILLALCHLAHQILCKQSALVFSREQIIDSVQRMPRISRGIVKLFTQRFSAAGPDPLPDCRAGIKELIQAEVDYPEERTLFNTLLQCVEATLKTNLMLTHRQALALRLQPELMGSDEPPFGVFFIHGRGFDAFHVRFRDIARGGLRIVMPRHREQFLAESERLFDEAYGLALAQQLKNKDIPEGGSKAVILAAPGESAFRCGKAFADSLLDLVVPKLDLVQRGVGEEVIYLGPDENVSNELIVWIVARARQRGYPIPNAFMSSKPGAGINHKQYGVTSEGVTVFLERALREAGIDPRREPFSVKLTGGPDGDVAGNEIRILVREFGERCRIVGIADGSGYAEDPAGLQTQELLRLVALSLPIAHFERARLGAQGRAGGLEDPDAIRLRNTLHNRVPSDAFIPAGGRPRTLNEENWDDYFLEDGKPASRVIVEGANLFITADARKALSERGVVIIRDSSANKCGVICSSFEIIASMLLDETEFLQLKEQFVAEVVAKLRQLAWLEADTLFREARLHPHLSLPELSTRVSRVINRVSDAIAGSVEELKAGLTAETLIYSHLPSVLHPYARERLLQRVPPAYVARIVAAAAASTIVYREGASFIADLPDGRLAPLALQYLTATRDIEALAAALRASDFPQREQAADLLLKGGIRVRVLAASATTS